MLDFGKSCVRNITLIYKLIAFVFTVSPMKAQIFIYANFEQNEVIKLPQLKKEEEKKWRS